MIPKMEGKTVVFRIYGLNQMNQIPVNSFVYEFKINIFLFATINFHLPDKRFLSTQMFVLQNLIQKNSLHEYLCPPVHERDKYLR